MTDHRLPLRELQKTKEYYERSLINLKEFVTVAKISLEKLKGSPGWESEYKRAKITIELDEAEAKVDVQQYHLQVYNDRIEAYMPTFEKESAETNLAWADTWTKSVSVAKQFPMSPLANVVREFPEDGLSNQELKNETFKVLKKQLKGYEETMKNKSRGAMKVEK